MKLFCDQLKHMLEHDFFLIFMHSLALKQWMKHHNYNPPFEVCIFKWAAFMIREHPFVDIMIVLNV